MSKQITSTSGSGDLTLRGMLAKAGVGSFVAPLAIQYMNFQPTTCEPYAQGVQFIVKGLQKLLKVPVDGAMDARTVAALVVYAGPRWYDKSWMELYQDVIGGRKWTSWNRESRVDQSRVLDYFDEQINTIDSKITAAADYFDAKDSLGLTRLSSTSDYFDAQDSLGATRFSSSAVGHTAWHHLGADDMANYRMVTGNIAVPQNAETLAAFKSVQRAVNGLLAKRGKSLIDVDGRIGPGTLAGVRAIQTTAVPISVESIAAIAGTIYLALLKQMSDEGASFVADPRSSTPASQPGPSGTVINPSVAAMQTTLTLERALPYAAIGVGVALLLTMGSKRSKRKRSKR